MAKNKTSSMPNNTKVIMKDFFAKYFELLEQYWTPDNTEDYWDNLTDAAMELLSEFETSDEVLNQFLQRLVVEFMNSREEA